MIWGCAGRLTIGLVVAACAGGARPSGHDGARPPFDAERVRLGRFHYENTMEGKSAGSSTISVARVAPDGFRFRNEVVGAFRQTWLPSSGYVPDHQPGFEVWNGLPFAHGSEHFELRIHIAVASAATPP